MNLLQKIGWIRLLAMLACLSAMGIYFIFALKSSQAQEICCYCTYGDAQYSNGACRGTSECRCMYQNGQCIGCDWVNNSANCRVAGFEE